MRLAKFLLAIAMLVGAFTLLIESSIQREAVRFVGVQLKSGAATALSIAGIVCSLILGLKAVLEELSVRSD